MIKKNQSAVNKQIHFIKCKQSCEKRETVCILINITSHAWRSGWFWLARITNIIRPVVTVLQSLKNVDLSWIFFIFLKSCGGDKFVGSKKDIWIIKA